MLGHVYLVDNKLNGKQYVGQTTVGDRRGHGKLITKAYRKYGTENFTYDVICSGIDNQATLNFIERFWIKVMDCRVPNGYNLEHGGKTSGKVSDETKAKISAAHKGRKSSKEAIEKMRLAKLGKKHTPEAIANMSAAQSKRPKESYEKMAAKLRGRKRDPEIAKKVAAKQIGKIVSEETKAKIREARSRQVITEEHKQKLSDAAKRQWARQKGVA